MKIIKENGQYYTLINGNKFKADIDNDWIDKVKKLQRSFKNPERPYK